MKFENITSSLVTNLIGDGKLQNKATDRSELSPKQYSLISVLFTLSYAYINLIQENVIMQVFVIIVISLFPGFVIMKIRIIDFRNTVLNLFFAILLSIITLMLGFFLLGEFLSILGIQENFSSLVVGLATNTLIFASSFYCAWHAKVNARHQDFRISKRQIQFTLATIALSLVAIHAVTRLNLSQGSTESILLTYSLMAFLLLLIMKRSFYLNSDFVCWSLWIVTFMILIGFSLRGESGFYGYDINAEFQVAGRVLTEHSWIASQITESYSAMLSITTLPAVLAIISKLSLVTIFKFYYIAVAALIPTVLFEFVRSYTRNRVALVCIYSLIFGSISFFGNFSALSRQIIGTVFFLGIWIVVFQESWSISRRKRFIAFLFLGLSFSHYTSSYMLAGIALLAAFLYFFFVIFDLFSTVASGSFQQAMNIHRNRIFTLPFVFLLIVITFSWSGVITQSSSNLTGTFSKLQSATTGLVIIPTNDENPINRYLKGTATRNPTVEDYKQGLIQNMQKNNPEFELRSDSFEYNLAEAKIPPIKPVLGNGYGVLLTLLSNIAKLWYQAIVVVVALILIFIFILHRRRSISDSVSSSDQGYSEKLLRVIPSFSSRSQLYDISALTFSSLLVAALLRSSGALAQFYNPDRAALQIALIWALPFGLFLQYIIDKRFFGKFVFISTVFLACVSVHNQIGLSGLYDSSYVSRISSVNDDANPFLISAEEDYSASWVSERMKPGDTLQMDGLARVNFLKFENAARIFGNIAPFALDRRSFIFANRPNIVSGVYYDNFIFNRYQFPSDYIAKYYLPVFVSNTTALYR
jgi:hypothetical protein